MDFGYISELDAEAIGEPGRRTFRIRARDGEMTASLWVEKQQLQALSLAIRRVLEQARHSAEPGAESQPAVPMQDFPSESSLDVRVGRLAIGWDEGSQRVIFQAYGIETPEDDPADFSCFTSAERALAFCDVADTSVAGGRPVCFLCREPIDPGGHACVRSNGHRKETIPLIDDESEEEDDR
ncbi:MAG: DUF3090 family protein [Dehalococcoidia bacterium]|nr:DUF3090 family protein [Dehalococcoidia bacterium]